MKGLVRAMMKSLRASLIYLSVYLSTPFLGGSVANELPHMMIKRHHYVHPIKIY